MAERLEVDNVVVLSDTKMYLKYLIRPSLRDQERETQRERERDSLLHPENCIVLHVNGETMSWPEQTAGKFQA